MRKKFVVCTHISLMEKEKLFKDEIERCGLNWWHWLPGIWLIVDENGAMSSKAIRNMALAFFGSIDVLVVEATGNIDWAGYGPAGSEERGNMFNWITDNWAKNDYKQIQTNTANPKLPTNIYR